MHGKNATLFLICAAVSASAQQTPFHPSDKAALAALDSQWNPSLWNGDPTCESVGVACSWNTVTRTYMVRDMNVYGWSLSGTIGTELGTLTMLRTLSLSNNELGGTIPTELGSTALSRVRLRGNLLTGTLPSEFFRSTVLSVVDLQGNSLSGTVPTEISGLTSLTEVNLLDNDFSGIFPPAKVATVCDIRGNAFECCLSLDCLSSCGCPAACPNGDSSSSSSSVNASTPGTRRAAPPGNSVSSQPRSSSVHFIFAL